MSAILPNINVLCQLIAVLEPENRSRRFDLFCEGQGNIIMSSTHMTIPKCMTVYDNVDNVAVAAIVYKVRALKIFL